MFNESFKRPEQVNSIRLTCPHGCPGTFENELTLMLHYNELHGVQGRLRNQPQQAEQNNGSQKAFQCPEPGCSMSSDKMKSVRSHMKRDHRGNSRLRWPCSHTGCAKDYANWYDLQTHIKSKHSGGAPSRFKWTSVGCPGDYANQSNLNQHLKKAHNIESGTEIEKHPQRILPVSTSASSNQSGVTSSAVPVRRASPVPILPKPT